jgi:hypothetical protein
MTKLADEVEALHNDVRVHDQLLYEVHGVPPTEESQRIRDSYCAIRDKVSDLARRVGEMDAALQHSVTRNHEYSPKSCSGCANIEEYLP